MKLLLDANLSWRLVNKLADVFLQIQHVKDTGLPNPAQDVEIWNWALLNDFTIVTNDEDFLNFSLIKGFPPKVILIRRGNLPTDQVAALLTSSYPEISALHTSPTHGLLEIV